MKVLKSSRHSKITGDFAERLVLYWLSKSGFECAFVDHVGLDIIARNPLTSELIGISVKSRSRAKGKEGEYVKIPIDNLAKLTTAAKTFACKPYFAVVVDEVDQIYGWLLPLELMKKLNPPSRTQVSWKMTSKAIKQYAQISEVRSFRLTTETGNWW